MKLTINRNLIIQVLGAAGIIVMQINNALPENHKYKQMATTALTIVMGLTGYLAHGLTPAGNKIPPAMSEELREAAVKEEIAQKKKEL